MAHWLPPADEGRVPGYSGYVPGMKNHLIGKRYVEASRRAAEASDVLKEGRNPGGMTTLVDNRPQGRDFLYAQEQQPLSPGSIGGPVLKSVPSASLPEMSYRERPLQTRKQAFEDLPTEVTDGKNKVPGYTGHQHGAQHIYGTSYGHVTRKLTEAGEHAEPKLATVSLRAMEYADDRPTGVKSLDESKVPGYLGYVPAKNHVYAKTYGRASALAHKAEGVMREGGNASTMAELVDARPQGRVDLYAQAQPNAGEPQPLILAQKGDHSRDQFVHTKDYKVREPVTADIAEVMEGRHHVAGYTGHVHGKQHIYAESYGKATRQLNAQLDKTTTPLDVLNYADDRPQTRRFDAATGTFALGSQSLTSTARC